MANANAQNYDARRFKCAPWHGNRGHTWTREFKPAMENVFRGERDNFNNLHQYVITGKDFGGWHAQAPAHIAGAGALAAQNALSIQARVNRGDLFLNLLETHILNPDIVDAINRQYTALIGAAPVQGGGGAVAGQLPTDWANQLWIWIDVNFGQPRPTPLHSSNQGDRWTALTLADVGIDSGTIRRYHGELLRLNRERQVPYPLTEVWTKFMKSITFPRMLADMAVKEMQAPTHVFAPGNPNAGQPDLDAAVLVFEELWVHHFNRGQIKPQKAPEPRGPLSNRVDGMHLRVDYDSPPTHEVDPNRFTWNIPEADLHEAFVVGGASGQAFAFLQDEVNCWTCRGWGHTKEKCPSERRQRPLSGCIQGLQQLQSNQNERLRNLPNNRRTRRPGPSPRGGNKPRQQLTQPSAQMLIEYDDGGVFTADGEMITPPSAIEPDATTPSNTIESNATNTIEVRESNTASVAGADDQSQPEPTDRPTENQQQLPYNQLDSTIEQQFSSSYSVGLHQVTDDNDAYIRYEGKQNSNAVLKLVCGVAIALGLCATAIRSARGQKILLPLLAFATPAGAAYSRNPQELMAATAIHSSEYARFTCHDCELQSNNLTDSAVSSRAHGIMDSGTTECASGRRSLFPNELIEKYKPNVKVEVASGVLLPVEIQGGMRMKVMKTTTTSTKKYHYLIVKHSFYVPKMPVTLISTKALFKYHGIRTYFNDELHMQLPNGDLIEFVETARNYTLIFADDDEQVHDVIRQSKSALTARKLPPQHANAGHRNKSVGTIAQRDKPAEMQSSKGRAMVPYTHTPTLKQPLELTWDLVHDRLAHFSPMKIAASEPYLDGIDFSKLGHHGPHNREYPCVPCIRGGFRGHKHGKRPKGKWTRFGQRVYSDSCAMPKSTPFGFKYMYIFYDAFSKLIALYFGKTTTAAEMINVYNQFITDWGPLMPKGRVEEWYADGGPEFFSDKMEEFCNEMHTRQRFIAPWNPWMNVAETGWRIILRPLRIVLAASNVSRALWPFAAAQIATIHNALSSTSDTATEGMTNAETLTHAFLASLTSMTHAAPMSPYFAVTKKKYDASLFKSMFCACEVRIRNKDDLNVRQKTDPITHSAMHLGIDSKKVGYLVYIFDVQRFTTCSYNDIVFFENIKPRLDKIVGWIDIDGKRDALPSTEQQAADRDATFPELDDITPPALMAPPTTGNNNNANEHDDDQYFHPKQCTHPNCRVPSTNGKHDDGDPRHDFERIGDNIHGPPSSRTRHGRNIANIMTALDDDETGVLAPSGHAAFTVAIAGDNTEDRIAIAYNTDIVEFGHLQCPTGTKEALSGPQRVEWLAAYRRELEAKIKNGTFTLVKRLRGMRVVRTKVAHALRRDASTNKVNELRARWVGLGFLQGQGDFSETYSATPSATSVRIFLCAVLTLYLDLAQGDVTKAFTLNPIDVEMYVEQMPGMEVAGEWPGATKENTVCHLHKCLEGLKQSGNVWQRHHTEAMLSFELTSHKLKFTQSTIDPTIFVLHAASGLIMVLVWIDDILVGYSDRQLYDSFVALYTARFPSKHHMGCTRFAGLSIDYRQNHSLTIHQQPHIELAYDKFVIDKAAAAISPATTRIAIADRESPKHYSKITMAANDKERSIMQNKPFLSALATIMYVAHWSLPHIAYHCSYLGQFMHDPSVAAFDAVISLIIYAYHNRSRDTITYTVGPFSMPRQIAESRRKVFDTNLGAHAYCDASWLLRSVSGYIILMCNGPVDWASKLIRVICHSSSEAEIAAGCFAGKRTVFIVQLCAEIGIKLDTPFIMLIDNSAALDLSQKLGVQTRTAHFLRWQHYLRWLVLHQYLELIFITTKEQLADMLTKVLDMRSFLFFCALIYRRRRSLQ